MFSYETPNRKLVDIALGRGPADIVIKDGVLMDVYTGRLLPHRWVAISGKWIAYVGRDARHTVGKRTKIIEADGRLICPGYIDAHTHLTCYWNIGDFLVYAIPGGTTTFITEVEAYRFARGAKGFRAFLHQIEKCPIKMYCLIPPMITLSQETETLHITRDEARELLKDNRVIGLGESYWQRVIMTPSNRVLGLIQETLKAGKSVQGHAAGAVDKKLAAYAAAGAMSCHEAISTDDVLSRLELGFYAMIREGDIRRDLEIILPLKDHINLRRVILVTDGTNPSLLIKRGYLVDVVQKAVDLGVEPIEAVQMVTLNAAEHFGLDHFIGGIAPGRYADILLLPESRIMNPDLVISNGRIIVENKKVCIPLAKVPYPKSLSKTVRTHPIYSSELSVSAKRVTSSDYIRTIDIQKGGLITREGKMMTKVVNGVYLANPDQDLLKIVFIERVSGKGKKFMGFVRGWGQKNGGVATSMCWDAQGIVGIGANDNDLAVAINRVIQLQGGTALSAQGKIIIDIPCETGGVISNLKIEDIASKLEEFQKAMTALGSDLEFSLLTLGALTTAAIPFIRMTEKGYFRFRENDIVAVR